MRSVSLLLVTLFTLGSAGCHLADDPEPRTCAPGTHYETGRCLADEDLGPSIKIALVAGVCTVTPAEITVGIDKPFSFENADSADHVVSGPDGKVWVTALAGRKSPLIGITRAGKYTYSVSDCAATGTVVVQ